MCGKRLVGVLRHQLAVLEKFGAISLERTWWGTTAASAAASICSRCW